MKTTFTIALTLLIAAPCAWAQEREAFQKLDIPARQLVNDWLIRDCAVGVVYLERLPIHRPELEPAFWEAYRLGPPPGEMEAARARLKQEYEAFRHWLATDGAEVFDDSVKIAELSMAAFVRQGMAAYEQRYRDAALAGLGAVCSSDCEPALRKIAENELEPGRFAARAAVERLTEKIRPEPTVKRRRKVD